MGINDTVQAKIKAVENIYGKQPSDTLVSAIIGGMSEQHEKHGELLDAISRMDLDKAIDVLTEVVLNNVLLNEMGKELLKRNNYLPATAEHANKNF